jgi:erythromycin esterase-like protein
LVDGLRRAARPLEGGEGGLDALIDGVKDSRIVLLGEATHGTHDFYSLRAEISKRLIVEHGFSVVAVEADWPDALALNSWAQGETAGNQIEAVSTFRRFPWWMWRNVEISELLAWIRQYNLALGPRGQKVGFYGLDLYSSATGCGQVDGVAAREDFFLAEQNARIVRNATQYFNAVRTGFPSSWNLRDRHMAETLEALLAHLDSTRRKKTRAIVWAHNSHVGDARATQLADAGELNLGQLLREKCGDQVALVGFTTFRGSVIAAHEWGAKPLVRTVRPALPESYEALFHRCRIPRFFLDLRDPRVSAALMPARLERAIGAVYVQDAELENHYFWAQLPRQFDVIVHLDETRALEPIAVEARRDNVEGEI